MELNQVQLDLLWVVSQEEEPGRAAGTKAVGLALLDLWKRRGGPHFWKSSAPWHGTSPHASELQEAGLVAVDVGIARFRRYDEPAESPQEYWLSLTAEGRRAIDGYDPMS